MSKKTMLAAALVLMIVAGRFQSASAQDSAAARPAESQKAPAAYRLDFTIMEFEDSKKINTRQYSMNSKAGDSNEIKIGTRVPVEVKEHEIQYLDVGVSLWCRLRDQADVPGLGNDVLLNVKSDVSSVVPPESGRGESSTPPVRQVKIEASTIAALGKPTVVGVIDDPNSKHQYQLEVTVTKLK